MLRWLVRIFALACLAVLAACATPSEKFLARAKSAGLSSRVVSGDAFQHATFWNTRALHAAGTSDAKILHVYLGGDGIPWRGGHPTLDPTPSHPLILRLIAVDEAPAVLLGRPCFHGLSETPPCQNAYWNDARYADEVVSSLTHVLGTLKDQTGAEGVVLFGASGGGALAVLMADRVDYVRGIVTVAANLDTETWLAYHDYDGLKESLNPAQDGRKNAGAHAARFERHYAGGQDVDVPPATVHKGLRSPDELFVIPDYDHNCCWTEIWPQVLGDVDGLLKAPPPAASSGQS